MTRCPSLFDRLFSISKWFSPMELFTCSLFWRGWGVRRSLRRLRWPRRSDRSCGDPMQRKKRSMQRPKWRRLSPFLFHSWLISSPYTFGCGVCWMKIEGEGFVCLFSKGRHGVCRMIEGGTIKSMFLFERIAHSYYYYYYFQIAISLTNNPN